MSTVLLAVDTRSHLTDASQLTRELCAASGDKVVVLHVHEFATGRWGRMQVDCQDGDGERVVGAITDELKKAGVTVDSEIREVRLGHIARGILDAADEHSARFIVLGSSNRTDVPRLPFGSVALRLLHSATRPVLIVPPAAGQTVDQAAGE